MHSKSKRIYKKDRVYPTNFRENAIQLALRSGLDKLNQALQ